MADSQYLTHLIQSFQSFLQSNQLRDFEQVAGGIKTTIAGVKVVDNVRNAHFTSKIITFASTAEKLNFNTEAYRKLENKYGKDRVLEQLVVTIDRLNNVEKTQVLAHLMHAVGQEQITWEEFKSLSFALEQLNPLALNTDITQTHGDTGYLESAATPYLIAVAMVSQHTTYDTISTLGVTQTRYALTPLGNKLVKYGIKPYQMRRKNK